MQSCHASGKNQGSMSVRVEMKYSLELIWPHALGKRARIVYVVRSVAMVWIVNYMRKLSLTKCGLVRVPTFSKGNDLSVCMVVDRNMYSHPCCPLFVKLLVQPPQIQSRVSFPEALSTSFFLSCRVLWFVRLAAPRLSLSESILTVSSSVGKSNQRGAQPCDNHSPCEARGWKVQ